jgi:hypothetical protein
MIIGWIGLALSIVARIVTLALDTDASKRYLFYGMEEGVKQHRNEDGSANIKKMWLIGLLVPAAMSVPLLIGGYLGVRAYPEQLAPTPWVPQAMASVPFLFWSIWVYIIWKNNTNKMKNEKRPEQREWRSALRVAMESGNEYAYLKLLNVQTEVNGLWYPQRTPWLIVKAQTAEDARQLLKPVLSDWLHIPDSDISRVWGDIKYHG